jgi:hypothetical protein
MPRYPSIRGTNHCDQEGACKGISTSVIGQTQNFERAQWPVANMFHNGMVFMTCTIDIWILRNEHVKFEQWLCWIYPRTPIYCAV